MTTEVVTVAPETSLKDVGALLVGHKIAGVPVCDADGHVLGVVSEADILWKELGLHEHPGGLVDRILENAYGNAERASAVTAAEAMTAPAITVEQDATVAAAAELMVEHRVNRLPVVDGGQLVGIVARADLVRAFTRSDDEVEREISDDVLLHTLWVDPDSVSLVVFEGKVMISGEVENRTTAELVEAYIRRVPGVVSVHSELTWQIDDRAHRTAASADQLPRQL
jgi:CBS domain-containing protein